MNKYQTLLLLIGFLLISVHSQKSVSLSCYTCGSTCSSGFCFNLTGNGINELLCPPIGYTCPNNSTVQLTINKCSVDYQGSVCSIGTCFSLANKQIAWLSNVTVCSGTRNVTCGSCTSVGCSICKIIKRDNVFIPNECVSSCSMITSVNQTIKACTNGADALGTLKNCCFVFDGSGGSVCTSQSTLLSSSKKLSSWVSGLFQFRSSLTLIILIFVCIGFMIV